MRRRPAAVRRSAGTLALCLAMTPWCGGVFAQDPDPADLRSAVAAMEALRVEGVAREVGDLKVRQGHLTLALVTGRAARVLAGGEVRGIFFAGRGTFEYTSDDGVELPVMSFNVKRATGLKLPPAGGTMRLAGEFEHALILMAGGVPQALSGGDAPGLDEEFMRHRERFLRDASPPASHDFAVQRLNAPGRALVRIEMGGDEDLVYVYDDVTDRAERLHVLTKTLLSDKDVRKYLWPVVLSERPLGRDRRDPLPSALDLTDVTLKLEATAGDAASMTVEETLVPRLEPIRVVRLSLFNETYALRNVAGVEPRRYHLRRVTDESGASLPFEHGHDDLLVGLPAPAEPGRPVRLTFLIDGEILIRPHGDNYWLLGSGPWFPQPVLAGQYYTMRATVRVKKPFVPFASGATIARREEGEDNVLETAMDQPDRFAVVLAGSYQFDEATRDGVTVRVASYAGRNELAIRQLTDLTFGIIKYYERFLGPFPCREFTIIEMNDYGWAQAPPGAMFITREAFESRLDDLAWLYTRGINERFAHEIAHQYWGHQVRWPGEEEQWLSEAFAEYCAALFVKEAMGKVEYNALVETWRTSAHEANGVSTIPLANRIAVPLDPMDAFRKRNYLLYRKGAWLLSRLHAQLGDQTFLTFLKSYQKSFKGKLGSTRHVAGLLEFITHKDFAPFFEANFWGTGMPD